MCRGWSSPSTGCAPPGRRRAPWNGGGAAGTPDRRRGGVLRIRRRRRGLRRNRAGDPEDGIFQRLRAGDRRGPSRARNPMVWRARRLNGSSRPSAAPHQTRASGSAMPARPARIPRAGSRSDVRRRPASRNERHHRDEKRESRHLRRRVSPQETVRGRTRPASRGARYATDAHDLTSRAAEARQYRVAAFHGPPSAKKTGGSGSADQTTNASAFTL